MLKMQSATTLKPSLKAFPVLWGWLILLSVLIANQTDMFAQFILFLFCLLPVLLIMLFTTLGRSYTYQNNIITKIIHITGQRQSIHMNDVAHVHTKRNLFSFGLGEGASYGQLILTLNNGRKFKVKNIKLPCKALLAEAAK